MRSEKSRDLKQSSLVYICLLVKSRWPVERNENYLTMPLRRNENIEFTPSESWLI